LTFSKRLQQTTASHYIMPVLTWSHRCGRGIMLSPSNHLFGCATAGSCRNSSILQPQTAGKNTRFSSKKHIRLMVDAACLCSGCSAAARQADNVPLA
jgi:hypothetical protein